jgi:hypothetical protein
LGENYTFAPTRNACDRETDRIVKDIGNIRYQAWVVDDEFDECGEPNYVEVVEGGGHE